MMESDCGGTTGSLPSFLQPTTPQTAADSGGVNAEVQSRKPVEFGSVQALHDRIKELMSAFMRTTVEYRAAAAVRDSALAVLLDATTKLNQMSAPSKPNENGVRSWMQERRKAHRAVLQLNARAAKAWSEAHDKLEARQAARVALRDELAQLHVDADMILVAGQPYIVNEDNILQIARYMFRHEDESFFEPQHPGQSTAVDPVLVPEQTAELEKLRSETLKALCLSAEANLRLDEIKAALQALVDSQTVDIQEPVRPVPEEIQRYLSQVEAFMLKRQQAHRAWNRANILRQELIKKLDASHAELSRCAAVFEAGSEFWHGNVHIEKGMGDLARLGMLSINGRLEGLEVPTVDLDLTHRTSVTAAEDRKMAKMRELMLPLATAMAHLNEAVESKKAAGAVPIHTVSHAGIVTLGGYQECLKWNEQLLVEQEAADLENLKRQTKIDLLNEAIKHYTAIKKDAAKRLHRYVVFAMPSPLHPPCDQMRALINASAHMYWFWVGAPKKEKADTTGDEDNPKKREGQYPVY